MQNIKDPLIVSLIFFAVASDWFDNWIRDMFPQLKESSPFMVTLIKTALFAGLYWLYNRMIKKQDT